MILSKFFYKRLARVFVISLKSQFERVIGRQFFSSEVSFPIFGNRLIRVISASTSLICSELSLGGLISSTLISLFGFGSEYNDV